MLLRVIVLGLALFAALERGADAQAPATRYPKFKVLSVTVRMALGFNDLIGQETWETIRPFSAGFLLKVRLVERTCAFDCHSQK